MPLASSGAWPGKRDQPAFFAQAGQQALSLLTVFSDAAILHPMRSKVRTAWIKLGVRRRRQVIRLAKRGRLHSDPVVAATSIAWASETLGVPLMAHSDWASAGLTAALLSWVPGGMDVAGSGLGVAGARWAERRVAQRILAAKDT